MHSAHQTIKCLGFVLCALAGGAYGQQASEKQAVLHLTADVKGLPVVIDEQLAGHTPLIGYTLPAGLHVIKVMPPDSLSWTARAWMKPYVFKPGEAHTVHVQFVKSLWVCSDPPGAQVIVNGQHYGMTPGLITLSQPVYTVVLRKEGYEDYPLQAIPPEGTLYGRLKPVFHSQSFSIRQPQVNKKGLVLGGTLSFALGAAGYWLKSKADSEYDAYMKTGHQGRMDRHFKNAEKYDQWSGALYILGEVGLGVTLYFSIRGLWQ
jgi:hypothetical protein